MNIFAWTDFYSELATALLGYADDRHSLIEKVKAIYTNAGMKLPTLERENKIVDIDPFTVFGLFNKGISNDNRITILKQIKELFSISAPVPTDFDGIPVLNNMSATFYYFSRERGDKDIDNLWSLFRYAISYADKQENEAEFITAFNTVVAQKGVSWNITMGLYWIRPMTFINLDARNRKLLENNQNRFKPDIDILKMLKRMVSAENYLLLMKRTHSTMDEYETFPELSLDAWKMSTEDSEAFYGEDSSWWPTLAEYDPRLSKEDWKKYLLEVEMPHYASLMKVLKGIIELGGEASCKQLSDKYGGHPSVYVGCTTNFGRRVKKYFNLPPCMDGDQERFFPLPFYGKAIDDEDGHSYIYKIRPQLLAALKEVDLSEYNPNYEEGEDEMLDVSMNTILYGPPGTGKTYNTVVYAVAIIENKSVDSIKAESYSAVLERYNSYKADGLIEFTTFHQSYGYEEFIEGIKPVIDNTDDEQTDIQYQISSGLFKAFCDKAGRPILRQAKADVGFNNSPTIWKVSLEGTGDNPTRRECMENGHIRVGYDSYGKDITSDTNFVDGGKNVVNAFISKMKIGGIVLSCFSSTTIDAIGVVTGEYEWHDEYEHYKRLRKVNWLVKGINEDITEINGGSTLTLSSVYKLNIALADVMNIISKEAPATTVEDEKKNYVFVIDEINRGNISKIFGELITLIEPSKRIGQPEGMRAKLPYSQQLFGVPDNVYIIGTMNTADRSIATIDTALRRRFRFKEMMPDSDVLNGIKVEDISVSDMLTRMNKRISVLYDREHTIGHAYFIPLRDNPTIEKLAEIFENAIVPLLQEYFYEDYEKIRLVLGDNTKDNKEEQFIIAVDNDYNELFGSSDIGFDDSVTYEINRTAFDNIEAYRSI